MQKPFVKIDIGLLFVQCRKLSTNKLSLIIKFNLIIVLQISSAVQTQAQSIPDGMVSIVPYHDNVLQSV